MTRMQGRILVVDDEKAMLVALKGLLSREGYQVETAQSGAEALRCIDTGSFHLVVTDLSMDGVSGMQVLEHARRVDPDAAVVMITAHGSEKIAVQAMKLVGASRLSVRAPFILEGVIQGALGAAIAGLVIHYLLAWLSNVIPGEFAGFLEVEPAAYALVLASGIALGFAGSLVAVVRFIGDEIGSS